MSKKHSIKSVSQNTGLSVHVLRAWEKRYGVVNPSRTETNRRYYSNDEFERLKLLKRAVDSGHSIGNIFNLSDENLEDLILTAEKRSIFNNKILIPEKFQQKIDVFLEQIFTIVDDYNVNLFRILLNEIENDFSKSIIIEEVILPILNKLDEKQNNNLIKKSAEQFLINELSFYIKQLINSIPEFDDYPILLTYSPIGGFSQIGSLISALTAKSEKWRVCVLGENISSLEISEVIRKTKPNAVSINMTYPFGNPEEIKNELILLKSSIPENIKILLSGRSVWNYRAEVNQIGGIFTSDTFTLRKTLQTIKQKY